MHQPPLLPRRHSLVLISVRRSVNFRALVRPEGLNQRKIAIEPATLRLLGQCLNQMRHRVPVVIFHIVLYITSFILKSKEFQPHFVHGHYIS